MMRPRGMISRRDSDELLDIHPDEVRPCRLAAGMQAAPGGLPWSRWGWRLVSWCCRVVPGRRGRSPRPGGGPVGQYRPVGPAQGGGPVPLRRALHPIWWMSTWWCHQQYVSQLPRLVGPTSSRWMRWWGSQSQAGWVQPGAWQCRDRIATARRIWGGMVLECPTSRGRDLPARARPRGPVPGAPSSPCRSQAATASGPVTRATASRPAGGAGPSSAPPALLVPRHRWRPPRHRCGRPGCRRRVRRRGGGVRRRWR